MEEATCPICAGKSRTKLFIEAQADGERHTYLRCDCGMVFLNPRPDAEEMAKYYDPEYFGEGSRKFRSPVEPLRLSFAWKRVRRVEALISSPGWVLDIGCGQGTFLHLLHTQGWICHGTELSAAGAARAARPGISISAGDLPEGQFPPGTLDLVTLWHVLEHLRDPLEILRRLHPMMKKGAILALSTPNIESLQGRLFRAHWFHLDPPRHLYLFSPRTLKDLLGAAGFRLLSLSHFSLEQNPYGWLQSFLNRMNFPHNGLYTTIKNVPAIRERRFSSWDRVRVYFLAAGMLPTCLLLSGLMALLGRGGTMEAYFYRE